MRVSRAYITQPELIVPTVYVTDAEIAESPTTRAAGVLRTVDIRRGSLGVRECAVDQ